MTALAPMDLTAIQTLPVVIQEEEHKTRVSENLFSFKKPKIKKQFMPSIIDDLGADNTQSILGGLGNESKNTRPSII